MGKSKIPHFKNNHQHQPPLLPPVHHPYNHQPPLLPPVHHPYNHQPHYSNYENTLIEEVIFLHSLWHHGPPFKKPKPSSDKEWPTLPQPGSDSGSASGSWPAFPTLNKPNTRPATPDERAKLLGVKTQLTAIESCFTMFRRGGEDEDEDEEEEEDDGDDIDEREFFEDLFVADKELRGFYKDNCDGNGNGGEFYCLICGVIGKIKKNNNSFGRKFKNCVALVQHSMSVSKTKMKKGHRAYGSVVCQLLGWDVNCLPSIDRVAESEVKNHADEDSTVAKVETNVVLTIPSQTERETIPDTLGKDNVANTDAGCIATELTHVEGGVKNENDEGKTAVKITGEDSQSQGEPEAISNAFEKNNGPSMDIGCIASASTCIESERKDSVDGLKVDNLDSEMDRVCNNSKNFVSPQQNNLMLDMQKVIKDVGEGCSVLDDKQCEPSPGTSGRE